MWQDYNFEIFVDLEAYHFNTGFLFWSWFHQIFDEISLFYHLYHHYQLLLLLIKKLVGFVSKSILLLEFFLLLEQPNNLFTKHISIFSTIINHYNSITLQIMLVFQLFLQNNPMERDLMLYRILLFAYTMLSKLRMAIFRDHVPAINI